jgi:hypothetical protein
MAGNSTMSKRISTFSAALLAEHLLAKWPNLEEHHQTKAIAGRLFH